MKTTILAFLSCLLVLCARGQSVMTDGCKCSSWLKGRVHSQLIRAGPFIHEPSVYCPRTEITIIMTDNKEKCVDPNSRLGQLILRNSQKKQTAVSRSTATASTQTINHSSPSLQTTTTL